MASIRASLLDMARFRSVWVSGEPHPSHGATCHSGEPRALSYEHFGPDHHHPPLSTLPWGLLAATQRLYMTSLVSILNWAIPQGAPCCWTNRGSASSASEQPLPRPISLRSVTLCYKRQLKHVRGRSRERLNKGLVHGWGASSISSPATERGNWVVLAPYWGLHGVPARLRTHYAGWQRSRCRRAMNRLASAQVTSRR